MRTMYKVIFKYNDKVRFSIESYDTKEDAILAGKNLLYYVDVQPFIVR